MWISVGFICFAVAAQAQQQYQQSSTVQYNPGVTSSPIYQQQQNQPMYDQQNVQGYSSSGVSNQNSQFSQTGLSNSQSSVSIMDYSFNNGQCRYADGNIIENGITRQANQQELDQVREYKKAIDQYMSNFNGYIGSWVNSVFQSLPTQNGSFPNIPVMQEMPQAPCLCDQRYCGDTMNAAGVSPQFDAQQQNYQNQGQYGQQQYDAQNQQGQYGQQNNQQQGQFGQQFDQQQQGQFGQQYDSRNPQQQQGSMGQQYNQQNQGQFGQQYDQQNPQQQGQFGQQYDQQQGQFGQQYDQQNPQQQGSMGQQYNQQQGQFGQQYDAQNQQQYPQPGSPGSQYQQYQQYDAQQGQRQDPQAQQYYGRRK